LTGLFTCTAVALALTLAPSAQAQGGITVSAEGDAQIRPDVLVIRGTLTESAADAEDASVAFRDTRRRAVERLEKLEVDGLTLSAQSLRVSRMSPADMGMMGGFEEPMEMGPSQLSISQEVSIEVAGIDQMEEAELIELVLTLSEVAVDAGLNMSAAMDQNAMMQMQMFGGGGGMQTSDIAVFKISDPEAASEAAAQAAMDSARAKAERLARLAGVELGPITAITEHAGPVESSDGNNNNYMAMVFGMMSEAEGIEPMTTTKLEDVTVSTHLIVTFAIAGE